MGHKLGIVLKMGGVGGGCEEAIGRIALQVGVGTDSVMAGRCFQPLPGPSVLRNTVCFSLTQGTGVAGGEGAPKWAPLRTLDSRNISQSEKMQNINNTVRNRFGRDIGRVNI